MLENSFRKLAEIQKQDWKALTIDEKKAGKSPFHLDPSRLPYFSGLTRP
jgi:hypothetical protein